MTEQVILVTAEDKPIGVSEKMEAHRKGICHRAFSIFVVRKNNGLFETLLQRRAAGKYHSNGLWSNACCGHPRPGESIEQAASRRLKEEMGLNVSLNLIGIFHYRAALDQGLIEDEVDHVFVGIYTDESIAPNQEEVSDTQWISFEALGDQLNQQAKQYTRWLLPAFRLVQEKIERSIAL